MHRLPSRDAALATNDAIGEHIRYEALGVHGLSRWQPRPRVFSTDPRYGPEQVVRHAERQFLDPGLGATAVGTGEPVDLAQLGIALRIIEPGERIEQIVGEVPARAVGVPAR